MSLFDDHGEVIIFICNKCCPGKCDILMEMVSAGWSGVGGQGAQEGHWMTKVWSLCLWERGSMISKVTN